MSGQSLVKVRDLGKRFKVYPSTGARVLEWATAGRRRRHGEFWALRGVSFEMSRGECLGVIGPNGAGKSTLLKILSRVLEPSEGAARVEAPVVYSLLELGTGFHPDLTGRENLLQSSRLLGLPPGQLRPERIEEIRAFADLGLFFDRPLRFYSSGMQMRLGFALFAFLQPDLLIVDEALSVGDASFQRRCETRIDALREAGTGLLFVSHSLAQVRKLCQRALLLNQGRPVFLGHTEEAIDRYYALVGRHPPLSPPTRRDFMGEGRALPAAADVRRGSILKPGRCLGSHGLEVVALRVSDGLGRDTLTVPIGGILHLDLLLTAREPVSDPRVAVAIVDRLGNLVFASDTSRRRHRLPALRAEDSLVLRISVCVALQAGSYTFTFAPEERIRDAEMLGPVEVFQAAPGPPSFHGMVDLPVEFQHGHVEGHGTDLS